MFFHSFSGCLFCPALFAIFTVLTMAKQLTQISFDFGPVEEPVQPEPVYTPKEKISLLQEPLPEEAPVLPESPEPDPEPEPVAPVSEAAVIAEEEEEDTVTVATAVVKKVPAGKRGRRSLKENALSADLVQVPEDEILFKKQYYSIGEVATMFRENQSLIRYWETEFDILQPRKNRKGDRFFRPVDIKNLLMIYDLLRRRKFTIEGAKDYLKKNKRAEERFAAIQSLQKIRSFLLELRATL